MAVPISISPVTRESQRDIEQDLRSAEIKHANAILAAYELLQTLNDHGVLEVLRGAVGAGDVIITKLATAANAPESVRAVRNLVSLSRILASVDPDLLHRLADELTSQKPHEQHAPPASLWRAIRIFGSQDGRRALVGAAAFVSAFGKALAATRHRA